VYLIPIYTKRVKSEVGDFGKICVAEGAVLDIDNDGMLSSAEFAEMAKLQAKHSWEDTSCRHAAFELRVDG
jgi:hypothetical protein